MTTKLDETFATAMQIGADFQVFLEQVRPNLLDSNEFGTDDEHQSYVAATEQMLQAAFAAGAQSFSRRLTERNKVCCTVGCDNQRKSEVAFYCAECRPPRSQ